MNSSLDILTDSREKLLMFKETEILKLNVADYTTLKLLNKYHIERKSLSDLYGTIVQGHQRFKREIIRAKENNIKMSVYVEGTREDFINKRFPQGHKRKMKSESLGKIIDTISKKYDLEFIFCHGRSNMKIKMIKRFEEEEAKLQ